MPKFNVQFTGHPAVEVDARDEAGAIEAAKVLRGLDGIYFDTNGLIHDGSVKAGPVVKKPAAVGVLHPGVLPSHAEATPVHGQPTKVG